jgi:CRISPR/Cas system-associated endonuclease Cas1
MKERLIFKPLQWMKLEAKPNRAELKNYISKFETSKSWKSELMYVVGATKAEYFTEVRKIVPNSFYSAW